MDRNFLWLLFSLWKYFFFFFQCFVNVCMLFDGQSVHFGSGHYCVSCECSYVGAPLSVFTRFSEGGRPHLPFTPSRRGHCQVQGSARNSSSFSLSVSLLLLSPFWKTGKQLAELHFVGARLSRFSFSCFIYHTPAFSLLHHALISLQPPWEIVLVRATHSALV